MLGAALTCLKITNREKVYTVDPAVWGFTPHDWVSIAAWNLGLRDLAARARAKIAIELEPNDMRLRIEISRAMKVEAA